MNPSGWEWWEKPGANTKESSCCCRCCIHLARANNFLRLNVIEINSVLLRNILWTSHKGTLHSEKNFKTMQKENIKASKHQQQHKFCLASKLKINSFFQLWTILERIATCKQKPQKITKKKEYLWRLCDSICFEPKMKWNDQKLCVCVRDRFQFERIQAGGNEMDTEMEILKWHEHKAFGSGGGVGVSCCHTQGHNQICNKLTLSSTSVTVFGCIISRRQWDIEPTECVIAFHRISRAQINAHKLKILFLLLGCSSAGI